jgi:hypothetical protein
MSTKKPKSSAKRKKRQPPRKVPLILQPRTIQLPNEEKIETTVGDVIVRACKLGAYRSEAAAAAGVSRPCVNNWQRRGEDAIAAAQEHIDEGEQVKVEDVPDVEQPFVRFVYALEEAEATVEVRLVDTISRASAKDWRAAAWLLARKFPDRWGVREPSDSSAGGWNLADLERLMDEAAAEEG